MTISGTNINPDSLKSSSVNDMSEYHTADSSIKRNFMIAMTLVAIAAITVGSIYLKKGHPLTGRCLLVPSSTALGLARATTIHHAIWDKNKSSSPTLESHEERTPLNTTNQRNSEINSRSSSSISRSSSRIDWVNNDEEYERDIARKDNNARTGKNPTPIFRSSSYYEALLAKSR